MVKFYWGGDYETEGKEYDVYTETEFGYIVTEDDSHDE